MANSQKIEYAIIGGGVAGLATALCLTQAHKQVYLFEAAPHCGGRARSIHKYPTHINPQNNETQYLDNCPHLIMGAYKNFFQILKLADVNINESFDIRPFEWRSQSLLIKMGSGGIIPALIKSHFQSKGLNPLMRLGLIKVFAGLFNSPLDNLKNLTVELWLKKNNINPQLINNFFNPLCLSALNTPPCIASAYFFAKVLQEVFFGGNSQNWQMYWAKTSLDEIISKPIINKIGQSPQNKILTNCRVNAINQSTSGVEIVTNGKKYQAKKVIIACQFSQTLKIISESNINSQILTPVINQLQNLKTHPIAASYLFSDNINIKNKINQSPILQHQLFQGFDILWLNYNLFRKIPPAKNINHPDLVAIYSALIPPHTDEFSAQAFSTLYNEQTKSANWRTITEKQATTSITCNKTLIPHKLNNEVYLVGDYLSCTLPATLETAVISAFTTLAEFGI